jgi:hypothetical protein
MFSTAIRHRESQRGFGNVINLVAHVGGMACRSLTALLGTNPGNDQPADAVLHQPDIESAADERAVAALVKHGVRCNRDAVDCFHVAGCCRERAALFYMKDLHDWNVASLGTIDERLEPEQEQRHVVIAPIRTMSKRLLRINDQECRSSSGHLMPPIVRIAFMIFAYVLRIERPKTVENGTEKATLFGGVRSPDGKYIAYGVKAEDNATLVVASRSFPALSKT